MEDDANEIRKAQQCERCKYDIFNVYSTLIYYGHLTIFAAFNAHQFVDAAYKSSFATCVHTITNRFGCEVIIMTANKMQFSTQKGSIDFILMKITILSRGLEICSK